MILEHVEEDIDPLEDHVRFRAVAQGAEQVEAVRRRLADVLDRLLNVVRHEQHFRPLRELLREDLALAAGVLVDLALDAQKELGIQI